MTQIETLKQHFEKVKSITNMEAQMMYRIRALPRRISDLETRGYTFNRVRKTDPTGQRYVKYVIVD